MKHFWKILTRRFTPAEVAATELANAELELLSARTAKEYSTSVESYNEARIKRLRKFLSELETVK